MMQSEQFDLIATALAKAQGAFPVIPRDKLVTVKMKSGGQYTFKYAPLETILAAIRGPLAENELALVQSIVSERVEGTGLVESVRTTMIHSSGQWLACDVPVFQGTGDNRSQAYMSGVTYSRRYGVTLLACVSADEDDDGNGGDQSNPRVDYVRNQSDGPRGQWPKSTGNKSRSPQRKPAASAPPQDPDPADHPAPAKLETDEVDPFGDGVTPGEVRMVTSRAAAAKLSNADLLKLCGGELVTHENVGTVLDLLKTEMQRVMSAKVAG